MLWNRCHIVYLPLSIREAVKHNLWTKDFLCVGYTTSRYKKSQNMAALITYSYITSKLSYTSNTLFCKVDYFPVLPPIITFSGKIESYFKEFHTKCTLSLFKGLSHSRYYNIMVASQKILFCVPSLILFTRYHYFFLRHTHHCSI